MEFKRAKYETRNDFRRKIVESIDGLYRVVESRCLLGPQSGPEALAVVVYAMALGQRGWDVISKHRKRSAAVAAVERCARLTGQHSPPRRSSRSPLRFHSLGGRGC